MSNQQPVDESVYKTAKSPRPGWANALIIAAVLVIAGIAALIGQTPMLAWALLVAALVTALIAGILALVSVRR